MSQQLRCTAAVTLKMRGWRPWVLPCGRPVPAGNRCPEHAAQQRLTVKRARRG
jgi:hypothetical protein